MATRSESYQVPILVANGTGAFDALGRRVRLVRHLGHVPRHMGVHIVVPIEDHRLTCEAEIRKPLIQQGHRILWEQAWPRLDHTRNTMALRRLCLTLRHELSQSLLHPRIVGVHTSSEASLPQLLREGHQKH